MNEYKLSITLGDKAYVCENNANDEDVIMAEFDSHDEAEKYIDQNYQKIRDGSNYNYYTKKQAKKKFKVYSEDLGYEEIIEADDEEEAITHGYIEIKTNIHDYIDINVDEIESEDK